MAWSTAFDRINRNRVNFDEKEHSEESAYCSVLDLVPIDFGVYLSPEMLILIRDIRRDIEK